MKRGFIFTYSLLNTLSRIIQVSPELLVTLPEGRILYPKQFLCATAGTIHMSMGVDDLWIYLGFAAKLCLHNRVAIQRRPGFLPNILLFHLEERVRTDIVQLYLSPAFLESSNG